MPLGQNMRRVEVTLTRAEWDEIQECADARGMTKSAFGAVALREHLKGCRRERVHIEAPKKKRLR